MTKQKTFEELQTEFTGLVSRREKAQVSVLTLQAEHDALKRQLRDVIEEAKKAGVPTENLIEHINQLKEVVTTKMEIFVSELGEIEKKISPMLKELDKG